jgi:hypothetical protein
LAERAFLASSTANAYTLLRAFKVSGGQCRPVGNAYKDGHTNKTTIAADVAPAKRELLLAVKAHKVDRK